jgi:hypothetical protein
MTLSVVCLYGRARKEKGMAVKTKTAIEGSTLRIEAPPITGFRASLLFGWLVIIPGGQNPASLLGLPYKH